MNWFKRKLLKWVTDANEERNSNYAVKASLVDASGSSSPDDNPILNFRIFSAQNGLILEFRHYDRKTDRNNTSTFIVNEGEDVSDFVRSCLPIELMKVSR